MSDPGQQPLDPRLHPVRDDLAAARYRGRYPATRFAEGTLYRVARGCVPMHSAPDEGAMQTTQLLFGEHFEAFEVKDGWAWGQALADNYVGYVAMSGLATDVPLPTHRVIAPASHIYLEADIKRPPLGPLYMGSEIAVKGPQATNGFLKLATGGWIFARHMAARGETLPDYVKTANTFLGASYLWGGKSRAGIDCSGLTQIALMMAGIMVPRDTDQQFEALQPALPPDIPLRRGDIAFFPGHVGIMVDGTRLLHANATHMAVTTDPLAEVIEIVRKTEATPYLGACRPSLAQCIKKGDA